MEKLTPFPEIPISYLQKLVSQSKSNKRSNLPSTLCNMTAKCPIISGSKPYYISDRSKNQNIHCICLGMKCRCKEQKVIAEKQKHLFRKKAIKQPGRKIQRLATQECPKKAIESDSEQNKIQRGNSGSHFRRYVHQQAHAQKTKQSEDRILAFEYQSLKRRLVQRYGISYDTEQIQKQIKQVIYKYYLLKRIGNDGMRTLTLKQRGILIRKVERQIHSQAILKLNETKDRRARTEKKAKKIQKQKVKNIVKGNKARQSIYTESEDFENCRSKKTSQQFDQSSFDLLNILLNKDNDQLIKEYVEKIAITQVGVFEGQIKKIGNFFEQYSNQQRIQSTISDVVSRINKKVKALVEWPGQQPETIRMKISMLKELMSKKEQKRVQKFNQVFGNNKSKKNLTIRKSINSINFLSGGPEYQSAQEIGETLKSLISLDEKIQKQASNGAEQQIIEQNRSDKKVSENSLRRRKTHLFSGVFDCLEEIKHKDGENNLSVDSSTDPEEDRKKQLSSTYLIKKKVLQRKITSQSRKSSVKFSVSKTFQQKTTNDSIQFSQFKKDKLDQLNLFRQAKKKEEVSRKEFMNNHHETASKGVKKLVKGNLQNYIISDKDTVFQKKLKLRRLKDYVRKIDKQDMLQQILAYINLYETQCLLILRNKGFLQNGQKQKFSHRGQHIFQLSKKLILEGDLKFIDLSSNYDNGEEEQLQKGQKQKRRYKLEEFKQRAKLKKNPVVLGDKENCLNRSINGFNDLIQTNLNQKGKLQDLDIVNLLQRSRQDRKNKQMEPYRGQQIRKNELKSSQRLKQWIERIRGFGKNRSSKFLMTQNSTISEGVN